MARKAKKNTPTSPVDGLSLLQLSVRSFYEEGNDLTKAFSYFVLQCISYENHTLATVSVAVEEIFKIAIPEDYLVTILKYLHRNEYIEYTDRSVDISILEKGREELDKISSNINKSKTDTEEFINSLQVFLKKRGVSISEADLKSEFLVFLEQNFYDISPLNVAAQLQRKAEGNAGLYKLFQEYFVQISKADEVNYSRLKDLVNGAIIAQVIKRPYDFKRGFKPIVVYLDTNIVFSLLGFHDGLVNAATVEIFEKLRSHKEFSFKIFGFTKDEISRVLYNYIQDKRFYSAKVGVNSVYYHFREKGMTAQDVNLLIRDIESKLAALEVEIDYGHKLLDEEAAGDEVNALGRLKSSPEKTRTLLHDVSAAAAIRKIRRTERLLFEFCTAFFLTADRKLYQYDLEFYEHSTHLPPSIPEVLPRSYVAGMLWLKEPLTNAELPIENLIAGARQGALIQNSIWSRFYEELKNQEARGELDEEQIGALISSNETEHFLLEAQSKTINEEDFAQRIREQVQRIDADKEKTEKEIKAQRKNIAKAAAEAQEARRQLQSVLISEEKRIERNAQHKVVLMCNLSLTLVFLVVVSVLVWWIIYAIHSSVNKSAVVPIVALAVWIIYYFTLLTEKSEEFKLASLSFILPMAWWTELKNKLIQHSIARQKKKSEIFNATEISG
jgi:uncharacterized membrane protein YqjE